MTIYRFVGMLFPLILVACASHPAAQMPAPNSSCKIPEVSTKKLAAKMNVQITRTIHADNTFSPDEREAIIEAKEKWETASSGIAKLNIEFDYSFSEEDTIPTKILLLRLTEKNGFTKKIDDLVEYEISAGTLKAQNSEIIFVVVDRIKNKEQLIRKLVREFGHGLGILDVDGLPAMMSYGNETINCLTQFDMMLFCSKYLCKPKDVNFCKQENPTTPTEEVPKSEKNIIDL
jgi:TusA-related sulfurtransferase